MGLGLNVGVDTIFAADYGAAASMEPFNVPAAEMVDYALAAVQPTVIIGLPDTLDLWVRGFISYEDAKCLVNAHGGVWELWEKVALSHVTVLSSYEAIEWARRNELPDEYAIPFLRREGVIDPESQQQMIALYDELPTVADVLHFLQRNVFDTEYVRDYQLMDGFEERFWAKYGTTLRAQGIMKETAADHYASHWINAAPGQMQEMVWRLRPGKPGVTNVFTIDDYRRILAEQDISPYFQPRFAEIAYRVPALGYAREMYNQFILDEEQLRSIHQDLGYTEEHSTYFVSVDGVRRNRLRASQGHGWTTASLASAYATGYVNDGFVRQQMDHLGYTPGEAEQLMERSHADLYHSVYIRARSRAIHAALTTIKGAISAGAISDSDAEDRLVEVGWPRNFAESLVREEKLAAHITTIKEITKGIKRAFLGGYVDAGIAANLLQQAEVGGQKIQELLALWTLLLTPLRKRRSAGQTVQDLANGWIDTPEALARLTILGYSDADQRLFLADASSKQAKLASREQSVRQRVIRQREAELSRIARESERQRKRTVDTLRRQAPPSKLAKWAELGYIGRSRFFSLMRLYGYTTGSIEAQWAEACQKKNATCQEDGTLDSDFSQGGPLPREGKPPT